MTMLVQRHYEITFAGDKHTYYASSLRAALALAEMFSNNTTKEISIKKREMITPDPSCASVQ